MLLKPDSRYEVRYTKFGPWLPISWPLLRERLNMEQVDKLMAGEVVTTLFAAYRLVKPADKETPDATHQ